MSELRLKRIRDLQKRRASAAKLRITARVTLIVAVSGIMVVAALLIIGVI